MAWTKKQQKEWRLKNIKHCKEYDRQYKLKNRDKILKKRKFWNIKTLYRITPEQYNNLINDFNGKCDICGKKPTKRNTSIDHNHDTGDTRGILCLGCNSRIGNLKLYDEKIIKYLQKCGMSKKENCVYIKSLEVING